MRFISSRNTNGAENEVAALTPKKKTKFTPVGKVDQAVRPLPPKTLSIKTGISVQSQLIKLETSGWFGLF